MPAETNNINPETVSPFLGLQYYSEKDANNFYGRDEEVDKLTTLLQINTLTLVFGKSGTGKTSLLNAGVFPKLRNNYFLPFRIRLDFNENSPDLVTQIKKVLKEEIDNYGFKVNEYPGSETLWEYFHKEPLWKSITPILVFDQFEEIFTLAKLNPRFATTDLPIFWQELSHIIENTIPEKLHEQFLNNKETITYNYKIQNTKVVFSFREEYLPEIESITSQIPSIKHSRFRLLPMNGNQAYEVITKTWKDKIQKEQADQIVRYFTNETGKLSYDLISVEPSLLSQVCAYIDNERIEESSSNVSDALLKKYTKETTLRSIYDEALMAAAESLSTNDDRNAKAKTNLIKIFIEDKLITSDGFRTRHNLSVNDEKLRPGLDVLINKIFIREDKNIVELAHDVLTPIIKRDREKRRREEAKNLQLKKWLKIAGGIALGLILLTAYLSKKGYDEIIEFAESERDSIIKKALEDSANIDKSGIPTKSDEQKIKVQIQEKTIKEKDSIITLDSIEIIKLKNEIITIKQYISDLDILFIRLKSDKIKYDSIINKQKELIENLRKIIKELEDKLLKCVQESQERKVKLEKLLLELEQTKLKLQNCFNNKNPDYPSVFPVSDPKLKTDGNTLFLNLTLGSKTKLKGDDTVNTASPTYKKEKIPDNLTIYLIPITTEKNKKIIRNASQYEIRCNLSNLQSADDVRTAYYFDGKYYFPNLPVGKYFIKFCTYYGSFYTIEKKINGDETSPLLDIARVIK